MRKIRAGRINIRPAKRLKLLCATALALAWLVGVPDTISAGCLPPPNGLVSWWSGEDHAYDEAGPNHGILKNIPVFTQAIGHGFIFNGVDDVIETSTIGMNVGTDDFTIEGWLETGATKAFSTIVEFEFHAPALYVTGPDGRLQLSTAAPSTVGGFNDNHFHHFAVVRRQGVVAYYKDGEPGGSGVNTNAVNQRKFFIGSDSLPGDYFAGVLDEISFYSRALSADEVKSIFLAGSLGKCKPAGKPFFIEAEDFDFGGGQSKAAANYMPYRGGAYSGLSAVAEIDYHDPGDNERAQYRLASQGVAIEQADTLDPNREGYDVTSDFRIGWNDPGDWYNYTRVFPSPARDYHIFARLSSGALSNAVELAEVTGGAKTANQTVRKIGEARGPASGGFLNFLFAPVRDSSGNLATVNLGGERTLRVTILDGGNEDFNYLQLVPVDSVGASNCAPYPPGLVAWWRAEGDPSDFKNGNTAVLNGAAFSSGKVGQAFAFDGSSAYVSTPLDVQPSAMPETTWEAWVFPTRPGARQQILSTDDGRFDRSVTVEGTAFGIFTGGGVWTPAPISFNQWQHIAVVFSAANIEFYKNGVRYSFGSAPVGGATVNTLNLGRNPGFGEFFQGKIDEVSIYNRGLLPGEINRIFEAGQAGKCASPAQCPALTISPATLPPAAAGAAYHQAITPSGGIEPYTLTVSSGALPAGLTLSGGVLDGTPTGSRTFSVTATDAVGCSATQSYTLTVAGGSNDCVPSEGLISWYRAENTAADSGGANQGTLQNGTTFAAGKVGQAFSLDGVDDYVSLGNPASLKFTGSITIAAWVNPRTVWASGLKAIVTKWGQVASICGPAADSYGLFLESANNGLTLFGVVHRSDLSEPHLDSTPIPTNVFTHVAMSYDATTGFLATYTNGVQAESVSLSPMGLCTSDKNVLIGGEDSFLPRRFPGLIDEVQIFDRGLTAPQIQALVDGCKPDISVATNFVFFGFVPLGQSVNQSLTISNRGTAPLTVSSGAFTGSRFSLPPGTFPIDLAPESSRVVVVTFSPANVGITSDALTLMSNDPDQPALQIFVEGSGLEGTTQTLTWNLAEDFRAAPNQENPIRDRYSNSGVWHLFHSGLTRNGSYTRFDPATEFTASHLGTANTSTFFTPGATFGIPFIGKNHSGTTLSNFFPNNTTVTWPNGTILAHPGSDSLIIAGWKSPITGTVAITGGVTDQDTGGGNGVTWFIDKNSSASNPGNLASGSIDNRASQRFSDGLGGASLANVAVAAGDFIYFVVDPRNNDSNFDSTRLDAIIQAVTQTGGNCVTPVAWWPGDGDAKDVQGGNNGTFAAGTYTSGKFGQAFRLNGTSDFIQVPDSPLWAFGTNDFTIDFWVSFNSVRSQNVFLGNDEGGTTKNKWIFWLNGGQLQFHVNGPSIGGSGLLIGSVPFSPTLNQFYHLALTRAGSAFTFYVDGKPGPTATSSQAVPDAAAPLTIGQAEGIGFLDGRLDEIDIFNRALSDSQIQAIFNTGNAAKCTNSPSGGTVCTNAPSGLISWWRAENSTDDSAGANHGILQNGATFAAGKVGQAFTLTNNHAGVIVGNPTSLQLQNFTIEAWIKRGSSSVVTDDPTSAGGGAGIFFYGSQGYGLGLGSDGTLFLTKINVNSISAGARVTDTSFHHVAVTKSGTSVVFYIDGVASPAISPYTETFQFTTAAAIGVRADNLNNSNNNSFFGVIDELSVYNRALTSNEIAAVFNAGSSGKCTNSLSGGTCPTVSSLSPTSGAVGSGMTISGTNFTGVTAVKFANNVPAAITTSNDTTLTVTVPNGAVTGPLTIIKPGCPDTQSATFTVSTSVMAQQAYLKASNTGASDEFGFSVAVAGDTAVVGAWLEDSNATGVNGDQINNSAANAGAVYIFARKAGVWTQQAYLKSPNSQTSGLFGWSVAISGNKVVVGAPGENSSSGAAYVFVNTGGVWTPQGCLKASNTQLGDRFGYSVAISGGTVVVGAISEASNATGVNGDQTNNSITDSGAAYVFTVGSTGWTQQAYLKASNAGAGDFFGISVGVSGDTVVVGANSEDSNATGVNGDQANNSAEAAGAAYVFVRNGTNWSQQAYLKASNAATLDTFGLAVAVSGDTVVVGANGEDSNAKGINGDQTNNSAELSGAAYVFVRSGTTWSQQAYLKASNTGFQDGFGRSVALADDTVVVGAYQESSNATGVNGDQSNDIGFRSGAAYVFRRSGTTWTQQAYLKASNTGSQDEFGLSVGISGDTVLVGAHLEDSNATGVNGDLANNSASDSGAAYIFSGFPTSAPACPTVSGINVSSGAPSAKVTITGANFNDVTEVRFANDVPAMFNVVNNTTITAFVPSGAVTGPITLSKPGCPATQTATFTVFPFNIAQSAYLKASNTGESDEFGYAVALSGDTLVIGASSEGSNATGVNGDQSNNSADLSGAVYVFVRNGTNWIQQAYLKASNTGAGDDFGAAVAISGDTLVVGADGEDSNATGVNGNQSDNSASSSGAAYVFVRNGGVWTQQAYLKASNSGTGDNFGAAVAISGETVVVGAYGEGSNATGVNGDQSNNSAPGSGAVYVFTRSGTTWSQQAYLKASNTGAGDSFGTSVAVAGDTLVVGASSEGSNATGVNGDQANNSASRSGAAYVFTRNGTTWSQQAYLKASNTGANDDFGNSVAVSGDTVVVGADGESSNATGVNGDQSDNSTPGAGAAYVFIRNGGVWTQQAYLKRVTSGTDGLFGWSVAISGDTIVVGADDESSGATGVDGDQLSNCAAFSGAACVFRRSGTTWSQQAYLKASNTGGGDQFGWSVAISGDTVVLGATGESGKSTGVNGSQTNSGASDSGAAYLFTIAGLPACPSVTSLNPSSGEVGGSVTITGANLTGVTAVKFANNVAASFIPFDDTTIAVTVPAGAVTGPITISKTNCTDAQTATFTVGTGGPGGVPGLKADYQFQGPNPRRSSVGNSPDLVDLLAAGSSTANSLITDHVDCASSRTVLSFPAGNGLALAPTTGLIPGNSYSIVILFKFTEQNKSRAIVDFKNGVDGRGVYADGNNNLAFPNSWNNAPGISVGSGKEITANTYVQVVLTRTGNDVNLGRGGLDTGYVNGVKEFQNDTHNGDGIIEFGKLRFFVNLPDGQFSGGAVARLRLYDHALSPAEVAALDRLPEGACPSACPAISGLNATSGAVGSSVTISGTNLTGVTGVKFANNVTATFIPFDDTTIAATVPAGAVTGPITISKTNCPDAQTATFTVGTGGPGGPPGLKADYQFQAPNPRRSSVGNPPDLVDLLAAGSSTANSLITDHVDCASSRTVLSFPAGNGLALAPTTGLIPSNTYSIVILFKFTEQNKTRPIVDFKNGLDGGGVYADGNNNLAFPNSWNNAPGISVGSGKEITANTYVQVVLTRTGNDVNLGRGGLDTGYVNGVKEYQNDTHNGDGIIQFDKLRFFLNLQNGQFSGGAVARIRLYDHALSPAEVAALDRLPEGACPAACPAISGLNPTSGAVGNSVTISGTNLTGVTAVKFANNVAASFIPFDDTTIAVTVPAGAVTGPITVSKANCPDAQTGTFTVGTGGPGGTLPGLKADYQFQGPNPRGTSCSPVLASPDLVDLTSGSANSPTTDTVDGSSRGVLSFPAGNGLALAPTTAVISSNTYSIVILFKFNRQDGWRRILDFRDSATAPFFSAGDNGLYADSVNHLAFKRQPSSTAGGSSNPITAGQYVQVVLTRDGASDLVTGYAGGVQQFQFADTAHDAVITPNPNRSNDYRLRLFQDDINSFGGEHVDGAIARLRLYNRVLSPGEVAGLDRLPNGDCPTATPTCPAISGLNPTSGPIGSSVTISGANLTGVTAVKFANNVAASFIPFDDATIAATVPAGAVTGPITISKANCPDAQTGTFTVGNVSGNAPAIDVVPASLDFGTVTVDQTAQKTFTIANRGTASLAVNEISSSNPRFAVVPPPLPFVLAPGAGTNLTVQFSPIVAAALETGQLTIASTDPNRPNATVILTGTSAGQSSPPLVASPNPLDFGTVPFGQFRELPLSLENRSSQAVAINTYRLFNSEYSLQSPLLTQFPFTLAPGGRSNLTIRFGPVNDLGDPHMGVLTLDTSHPDLPALRVVVTGRASPRGCDVLDLAPGPLASGTVGEFYNRTLTVSGGTAPYSFSLAGGALPDGLTLSANGILTGTPVVADTFNFTVRAVDLFGCTGTRDYSLTIRARGPKLNFRRNGSAIVLSWPAPYRLEATDSLSPPMVWRPVTDLPTLIGSDFSIEVAPSQNARFYRLSNVGTGLEEPLQLPDDWLPIFPVIGAAQTNVSASTGGVLRLSDGATLAIPAGALSSNTLITLRKLDFSEVTKGVSRVVYEVDAGGAQLQQPAVLTLPYGTLEPGAGASAIHVFRSSPEEGTEELPGQVDLSAGTVRVTTDHFSLFAVEQDGSPSTRYLQVRASQAAPRILPAPYYPQGPTMWCFAAASQMMLKYFGVEVEAWEVARHFQVDLVHGPKPWRLWAGHYADFFNQRGQPKGVKMLEWAGWISPPNVNGYIIQQIDASRPVFVIVQNGLHALVVAGYDPSGFYVHDPSGHSIHLAGISANQNQYGMRHFTWDQWSKAMLAPQSGVKIGIAGPVYTVVLDGPSRGQDPPITLSLLSASYTDAFNRFDDAYMQFNRREPNGGEFISRFVWDGTVNEGYRFVPDKPFLPTNAAISDKLVLYVHLNNMEDLPASTLSLKAAIDGQTIYQQMPPPVPARSTLNQIILFDTGTAYSFKTGVAGLIPPGPHTFDIELSDGAGILDSVHLKQKLGPGRPEGLTKSADPGGGVKLAWNANVEASTTTLFYDIYRDDNLIGTTTLSSYTDAAGPLNASYTIVANAVDLELESPPSAPATTVGGLRYLRQDPPSFFVRTTSGNLDKANLIVTATDASAIGPDGQGTLRLFWDPPPAQLQVDTPFPMRITAEAIGAPAQKTSFAPPPFLEGQINDLVHLNRAENAVVGYELFGDCPPAASCTYKLTQHNLDKQTTMNALFPFVTIDARIFRGSGLSVGEVTGTITWTYKPAP